NLAVQDMSFKSVCFARTWNPFKPEEHLIAYLRTDGPDGWNNKGFGANDPGFNRGRTEFRAGSFFLRYPLNDHWICRAIQPRAYNALELLRAMKEDVPFWFKFQGNRLPTNNQERAREARRDYQGTTITIPHADMTARELLVLIASSLPGQRQ